MEIMEDDNATEMHESGTFDDMVKEVESHLQGLIQKHYKPPESVWESLQAFGHAINWNEPFIQIIIAFHLILFSTILWKRRSVEVQFVLFLFITATVFMAERINTYGAMHWREFASQNYFDRQGVFCSIFLSAPLLFFALVQLINLLLLVSADLIKSKRMQIQRKLREEKEAQASSTPPSDSSSPPAQE